MPDLVAARPDLEMTRYEPGHGYRLPAALWRHVARRRVGTVAGWRVVRVDGTAVRDRIDIDFVAGGNPMRYKFVPAQEIWIEDSLPRADFVPVVVHEIVEAVLMHDGQDYDTAHDHASATERIVRLTAGTPASWREGLRAAGTWVRAWQEG